MRAAAEQVVQRLQSAGFEAYWVGGCVRDRILGREPQDYDIATSARPAQIERLFGRANTIPVGRQFGVIIVRASGHLIQVATFRADAEYSDGRRPDRVRLADARGDAARRDFTINGLFFDPVAGRLHDWVGGSADLERRVVRTIGDPAERFAEDHLRLLRAVRFAAQLGFTVEPVTWAAIRDHAARIERVSAERVRDELIKLFAPPHAGRGLDLLRESGLMGVVLPELVATVACDQSPEFHPEGTVYNHIRLMLERLPADAAPSLPWAVLLHDVGKPPTASTDPKDGAIHFYGHERVGAELAHAILTRLRFPRRVVEEIVFCVRHHMQFKDVPKMRKSTLRRLLLRPTLPVELELHRLDCLGSHGRLDHYEYLVRQRDELARMPALRPPLITGEDLLAMGMRPGPALGALLREVRDKQLQEELRTPEEAREWARRALNLH